MDINDMDLSEALEVVNAQSTLATYRQTADIARAKGDQEWLRTAEAVVAELPQVSALDALQANARAIDLLTSRRWLVMREAREEGATWEQIGAALGMSRQSAHEWYSRQIEHQERYAGDFHDTERARAALNDRSADR
jgi:hypothetical protein